MRKAGILLAVVAVVLAMLPARAADPSCNWPMFGHDNAHSFAQTAGCSRLNSANAAALAPKWFVFAPDSVTASPTVLDGIVYVGAWDGHFFAIDAETGTVLWIFLIEDDHNVAFGRIVSSAWAGDLAVRTPSGPEIKRVVIFGGGATLYVLEAGREGPNLIASIDVDPRDAAKRAADAAAGRTPQIEIESSPAVARFDGVDRIFVGMDVHNGKNVGRTGLLSFELTEDAGAYAFDLRYKFDPEGDSATDTNGVARSSLTDGSGTGLGCGGVWSSPAIDASARGGDGIVVFGTGNCESPSASPVRESIWAIEARTGAFVWSFTPSRPAGYDPDDDFGSSPNLLPGGLVGEGSKDGTYYARNLTDGSGVYATRAAQPGHAGEGFAVGGFIGTPAVGLANGKPTVFATSALPLPFNDTADGPDDAWIRRGQRLASLHAIDAATGKYVWDQPLTLPSYGHPTYAPGVIVEGVAKGVLLIPDTFGAQLQVIDADTGALLRAQPLPGAPSSAPAIVGNSIYMGVGTRETDAEYKAFGDELGGFLTGTIGAHPLSPLSGIAAFQVVG